MDYFISIFLGTFVLEDVALASSLVLVAQSKMTFAEAFMACFLGISVGDIGLYFLGFLAAKVKYLERFYWVSNLKNKGRDFQNRKILSYAVFVSRAIPGTRLPTYLVAGYLSFPFLRFFLITIVSVSLWVALVLGAGFPFVNFLSDHALLALLSLLAILHVFKKFLPLLIHKWKRRSLIYAWQKWLPFEFWPAWLFYIPIVPYYIYLSLKYKGFLLPFYVNPNLKNGGFIGESKWEILKSLDSTQDYFLKTVFIPAATSFESIQERLKIGGIAYPFILKPDVGQRGFGVRLIRTESALAEYVQISDFDLIAQEFSDFKCEAGVFYIRKPSQEKGVVFSITDKKFPFVVGDGKTLLGDLVLRDKRARIIADVYFARLQHVLDTTPAVGERVFLSECGNHCQGAIFENGSFLNSPKLEARIDELARSIPDFYFGRFDIKYKNVDSFSEGSSFKIVEVNGPGSEATHIWDAKTSLKDAYATLFKQWNYLFSIGSELRARGATLEHFRLASFLAECLRVFFRKNQLSVSS